MKALLHRVASALTAVASFGLATSSRGCVAVALIATGSRPLWGNHAAVTTTARPSSLFPMKMHLTSSSTTSSSLHATLKFKSFEGMLGELQTEPLLLVYFYKDLCGPCKLQRRELNIIASQLPMILAIDVEKWPHIGARHKIGALPCVLLIRQGQEVDRMEGLTLSDDLFDRVTTVRRLSRVDL